MNTLLLLLTLGVGGAFGNPFIRSDGKVVEYLTSLETMHWSDAAEYCQNEGGHLAFILAEGDQNRIEFFLKSPDPAGTQAFWIGLSDLFSEGKYTWMPGELPATYTNWNPGQPSGQDFIYIMNAQNYSRQWNDIFHDNHFHALCEVEF